MMNPLMLWVNFYVPDAPKHHVTECALIHVVVNTESILILCLIKDCTLLN